MLNLKENPPVSHQPIDELLTLPAFESDTAGDAFLAAVDDCLKTLRRRFPRYASFLAERGRGDVVAGVRSFAQIDQLPPLFLPVLKGITFDIPDDVDITVRLTSSGTTGVPSVVPLDDENMQRRVAAMSAAYRELGIVTGDTSAVCFLMDPATTQMAGSLVIDGVLRSIPEVGSVEYLARMTASGPEFDRDHAIDIVTKAVQRGPVLAVGYPALIANAVTELKAAGVERFPLPEGSLVLTGGGWKSFLPGVQLDQSEFRDLTAEFFGLPASSIRDMFGLSECPAVFVQCEQGGYHIPAFTQARAIDPETGCDAPAGKTGLLQLTTPLTTSYPLLKILTTDKAVIADNCPCGRSAATLVPKGRVTAARFETCAMKIGRAVA